VPYSILLVEDEYASLEVLALLLEKEGYQVVTASDGEEALSRLHERRPDLVITDFWMPRMDGVALCQRMSEQESWREIPVILISGTYEDDVPRPPGVVGYVRKPMLFSTLLASVRRALGQGDE
jgi:CheY-like chemotaxis protein